ncbi:kinase-like protein [Hygrophoropsis aurantiaca]|uniref:Kinase-like protein n=1 Tax=Hygrophoropsis aurantiaca TaxID=72124 RepID=A0ACB8AN83_9AGAM|nr:kinase-like protein [Hygrophoropsis aurantiaca]
MAVNISKKFIGAVKDEWQLFSDRAADYTIGSPIGFGASSIVCAAIYNPAPPEDPNPVPCALKIMDLDSLPLRSLSLLQRETQLMSLSKHPNVLRVRGSWIDGHKLYIAMRLMNRGSAADVMHYGWPGGMEEEVVKCILKQALEGLNYLHTNGFIHRDVKAANLLIDDDGTVLLGDLGVAAPLFDDGVEPSSRHSSGANGVHVNFDSVFSPSKQLALPLIRPKMGKRKSFVGTPCWMAPELIQGKRYDSKADIWSFAITAIELTQGRPPRSRESPHSVLLQTVQGKPPTLDRESGVHRYSRAFKATIDSCLIKDPSKRPTAAQLLQTPFFKSAKKKSYLVSAILEGLPPLAMRQERRRRQASIKSHGTIDSWDFSSTVDSAAASIKGPSKSPKAGPQALKSLSSLNVPRSPTEKNDSDAEFHDASPRSDLHPRFVVTNRQKSTIDASMSHPISIHPTSPLAISEPEIIHSAKEELLLQQQPTLPPLSSSPSTSSDSARSDVFSDPFESSGSSLSEHAEPVVLSRRRATTTAVDLDPQRASFSPRKHSFAGPSSYIPASSSSPPMSSSLSSSPGFWQRLTRPGSRGGIPDDDGDLNKEKRANGFVRILNRRGSSIIQRPS